MNEESLHHDYGAGGRVTDITSTNGQRFILASPAKDGNVVVSLVRRLVIECSNDEDIDKQFTYNDIAFLTKSLINYMYRDIMLVKNLGNSTQFFSSEDPVDDRAKRGIIADMRNAGRQLIEVADIMETMPVAQVDAQLSDMQSTNSTDALD